MNIEDKIQSLRLFIERTTDTINWLARNQSKLESIETDIDVCGEFVDFNYLPHETTVKVLLAFPGKWDKKINDEKIDYTSEWDGKKLRVYRGEPPPNCKIVDAGEEYVPGYIRRKYKLECPTTEKTEEPAPEATNE